MSDRAAHAASGQIVAGGLGVVPGVEVHPDVAGQGQIKADHPVELTQHSHQAMKRSSMTDGYGIPLDRVLPGARPPQRRRLVMCGGDEREGVRNDPVPWCLRGTKVGCQAAAGARISFPDSVSVWVAKLTVTSPVPRAPAKIPVLACPSTS